MIPNAERTPEELREITRKGGIASGVARRAKRDKREWAKLIGSLPFKMKGADGQAIEGGDYDGAAVMAQFQKAIVKGDTAAFNALAKLTGEMKDSIEVSGDGVAFFVTTDGQAAQLKARAGEDAGD